MKPLIKGISWLRAGVPPCRFEGSIWGGSSNISPALLAMEIIPGKRKAKSTELQVWDWGNVCAFHNAQLGSVVEKHSVLKAFRP